MMILSQNDIDLGRRLTEVTMGIDALERRLSKGDGPLDSEGLVPIYLGQDLVDPQTFRDWTEVEDAIGDLAASVSSLPASPRRLFLDSMVRSLRAVARLFSGKPLAFAEALTDLVGVPAGYVAPGTIETIHERLDALLREAGYGAGDLGERSRRWQADRKLDPSEVPAVFMNLMSEAQQRTDALIWKTGDYSMALRPISDVPYTARCNFDEGAMELNMDLAFTRAGLKHLVAHEVFPGHSTQLLATRALAAAGAATPDVLLCTANTVTGCVQEGIGDQGVELIDWIEDVDDAIQVQLRRLSSSVATDAAWMLMGEGRPEAEVADYLSNKAFGQPAWVKGRIRLARHPFRGAFIASYWFGNEAVREVRERTQAANRTAFIDYLYGQLQSPESLKQFRAA